MCLPQSKSIVYLNNVRTNFPKYIPKGKLANFLESYAVDQELCIWLSSTITSTPIYDSLSARWTVEVQHGDQKVILNPKHLVLATGSGSPHIPTFNGMDEFQGALYHSDFHTDAEQFRGKRIVVVGAVSHIFTLCTRARTHETVRAMLVGIYVKIL
jgi:cation diffusion facilitator CzcD-associated flavoprotein CzcO